MTAGKSKSGGGGASSSSAPTPAPSSTSSSWLVRLAVVAVAIAAFVYVPDIVFAKKYPVHTSGAIVITGASTGIGTLPCAVAGRLDEERY